MVSFLSWVSSYFLRLFTLVTGSTSAIYATLGQGFSALIQVILSNWIFTSSCAIVTIICLIFNTIQDPDGAINTFMRICIDIVTFPLPSTPQSFKLASLVSAFDSAFPVLGTNTIKELLEGVVALSLVSFAVRILKYLPFF
jgi:hypothetical protein